MTKLARAVVTALPLVLLLAACTPSPAPPLGDPTPPPSPVPSLEVPDPSPTTDGTPGGRDLTAWADAVLPENRPGGAAPVVRGVVPLDGGTRHTIAIDQEPGIWDVVFTCQSSDGSPLEYYVASPALTGEPRELECSAPGEPQPSTAIVAYDGPGATLELSTTADLVVAYQIRSHMQPEG